jgi:hypothetical protein
MDGKSPGAREDSAEALSRDEKRCNEVSKASCDDVISNMPRGDVVMMTGIRIKG